MYILLHEKAVCEADTKFRNNGLFDAYGEQQFAGRIKKDVFTVQIEVSNGFLGLSSDNVWPTARYTICPREIIIYCFMKYQL